MEIYNDCYNNTFNNETNHYKEYMVTYNASCSMYWGSCISFKTHLKATYTLRNKHNYESQKDQPSPFL